MVEQYLKQLVGDRHIPGAVLYISKNNRTEFFQSFGSYLDENNLEQPIYKNTIFDVASLTKIMATLPSILVLTSRKELHLESSVHSFLPQFTHKNITLKHLLEHSSGLPADLPYKDRMESRDVMSEIFNTNLGNLPGAQTVYSDLGMILLGKVIEKVSGQSLDLFAKESLFKPWGLSETSYLLPDNKKHLAASTEWYKDRYLQGVVHDEKAYQLGGVSGSAGIFSTAEDIVRYASHWLYPEEQSLIAPELMRMAVQHRMHNRGLGFEVWSGAGEPLSIGSLWPSGSFGHTGFTGTSAWICPQEKLVIVFLTNAVHFGRGTLIRSIRKQLHSLIYSAYNPPSQ
ncbi:serine hydrolase [Bacillus sp. S/N-304-OC-R1]|uniref:serine hydrolase domain-containing protein n=1 Tax=Bacillus sp. S/N-304-OC-R1 TaxID=2758034 RepID=UPI001C8E4FE3|nr:serine hydrolase domain-containing protein [Bacillus sp. S/N-304-OC-R1]MBY0123330.1 beta-lactamase family protein [Bacillus sp. S/N-304-OC-R1]